MEENLRYTIVRPTEKKDRYALACYVVTGRKNVYQELPDKIRKLARKINDQYQDKLISNLEAETLLKDLIQNEYKKLNVRNQVLKNSVISEVNQKTFNKFWDKVYSIRYLSDEKSPKHDILKALKLIEPLSIQTSTASQLQNKLRDSGASNAEIKRASDRLNQLLKFLGRDFKLNKPKATYKKVQYVTLDDFNKIHAHLPDSEMKDFAMTLFSTGLRFSEALALTKEKD